MTYRSSTFGQHPKPRTRWGYAALLLVAAGFVACSSQKPEAAAPAADAATPGQYPGESAGYPQQQLPYNQSQATAAPAPTYSSAPDAFGDLDRAEKLVDLALDGRDATGLATTSDRCTLVCDALASMRRAADRVCVLDATRCGDAKTRVSGAEERAKSACPACAQTPT